MDASWVATGTSVVALIVSVLGVLIARRTARIQAEQNVRQAEDERRSIASRVGIWATLADEEPVVRYVNDSNVPIYSLTVFISTPLGNDLIEYFVHGPHLPAIAMGRPSARLRDLLVGQEARVMIRDGQVAVACSFRDATGLWWFRARSGELCGAADERHARAGALGGANPAAPILTQTREPAAPGDPRPDQPLA
jgi:PAS domain-containing protein